MEIIKGSYWIVGGLEKDELFASLQLGDNQHRRDYLVNLRCFASGVEGSVTGDVFPVRLRIDGLKRTKSINHVFDFEAVAVLPVGLVKVRGQISLAKHMSVRGDLHTMSRKECRGCLISDYTDRKRCDECGETLSVMHTYSLL